MLPFKGGHNFLLVLPRHKVSVEGGLHHHREQRLSQNFVGEFHELGEEERDEFVQLVTFISTKSRKSNCQEQIVK